MSHTTLIWLASSFLDVSLSSTFIIIGFWIFLFSPLLQPKSARKWFSGAMRVVTPICRQRGKNQQHELESNLILIAWLKSWSVFSSSSYSVFFVTGSLSSNSMVQVLAVMAFFHTRTGASHHWPGNIWHYLVQDHPHPSALPPPHNLPSRGFTAQWQS